MYIGLHVKCPVFLSDSTEPWIFLTDFRKTLRCQISWKSVRRGLSSVQTDGWTDMTKLMAAFRSFAIVPIKAGKTRQQWCDEAATSWNSVRRHRARELHAWTHTRRPEGIICRKTGTICGLTIISFLVPRMCNDLLLIANKLVSVILLADGMRMSLCSL